MLRTAPAALALLVAILASAGEAQASCLCMPGFCCNQRLQCNLCPPRDAGGGAVDGGQSGGTDAGLDAGVSSDAGPRADAGPGADAGPASDAGLPPDAGEMPADGGADGSFSNGRGGLNGEAPPPMNVGCTQAPGAVWAALGVALALSTRRRRRVPAR